MVSVNNTNIQKKIVKKKLLSYKCDIYIIYEVSMK